jgi:cyclophilin family peptidyl-prolyl cis-trans isomerase
MPEKLKKCPFCGAEVGRDKFSKHLRKVHADLDSEEFKEKGMAKPTKADDKKKIEREEKKREFAERRKKRAIAAVIVIIIVLSVAGVIVYQGNILEGGLGGLTGGGTVAVMQTSMGMIKIRLYTDKAPNTARNFINLARNGFYNGLIFHRVVSNFVIQGGGYTSSGGEKSSSQIPWEQTGYKNNKYTLAMARSGSADQASDSGTATSQFFINLKDNSNLDSYAFPYVVFGVVIEGSGVVDAIGALPTGTHAGMSDWPLKPPVISSVTIQG